MLSRTADHLFWMSRYTERAENTARMLDVNYQTSLLPQSAAAAQAGWMGMLSISELKQAYALKHGEHLQPRAVMDFMVRDENNPSSIISCLRAARENARAVRGTLTTEVWETQNQTYLEVVRMLAGGALERDPAAFFEWVKFHTRTTFPYPQFVFVPIFFHSQFFVRTLFSYPIFFRTQFVFGTNFLRTSFVSYPHFFCT